MKKLMQAFPDYTLLMHYEVGDDGYPVLLRKDNAFAVCILQPRRKIAFSLNYLANGDALLTGPLTRAAFAELLQWTEWGSAVQRFRKLAHLPQNILASPGRTRP